jgi:hypothetical protein
MTKQHGANGWEPAVPQTGNWGTPAPRTRNIGKLASFAHLPCATLEVRQKEPGKAPSVTLVLSRAVFPLYRGATHAVPLFDTKENWLGLALVDPSLDHPEHVKGVRALAWPSSHNKTDSPSTRLACKDLFTHRNVDPQPLADRVVPVCVHPDEPSFLIVDFSAEDLQLADAVKIPEGNWAR